MLRNRFTTYTNKNLHERLKDLSANDCLDMFWFSASLWIFTSMIGHCCHRPHGTLPAPWTVSRNNVLCILTSTERWSNCTTIMFSVWVFMVFIRKRFPGYKVKFKVILLLIKTPPSTSDLENGGKMEAAQNERNLKYRGDLGTRHPTLETSEWQTFLGVGKQSWKSCKEAW